MFGENFKRKYALSDQGVKNVKKGTFWTTIVNLVAMLGMGILYLLMAEFMNVLTGNSKLPSAWIFIALIVGFLILSFITVISFCDHHKLSPFVHNAPSAV